MKWNELYDLCKTTSRCDAGIIIILFFTILSVYVCYKVIKFIWKKIYDK